MRANVFIPGETIEEAQRKADEEERKMLAKQHADPDFLLCRHGKKEWRGSDPCCAFDEDGKFRERNWNCRLMSKIRSLMGQWADDEDNVPGHYWWDEDQNYGVLYIPAWLNIEKKQIDSYLLGCFILIDWYKSRGKTDSFRVLEGDKIRQGTEGDALEIARIFKDAIKQLWGGEDDKDSP